MLQLFKPQLIKKIIRKKIVPLVYSLHKLFYTRHYRKMVKLFVPNLFKFDKVKYGRDGDGTYILPDNFIADNGVLLSFGVADDTSFEEDFNVKHPNFLIYTFDPSIDALPSSNENINFDKIGVAGEGKKNDMFLTIDQIIQNKKIQNKQIVIKMDIEGWEWGVFNSFRFDKYDIPIIVIEFHMMTINSFNELIFFPFHFYKRMKTLKLILEKYYIFHEHANNYQYSFFKGFTFPWLIELTLIRKSNFYDLISSDINKMNQVNCNHKPDFQYPFIK